MARTKKPKLPKEIREAISEKIEILSDMGIVNRKNEDNVRLHFETSIETQPERDPYVIMDQISHAYIEEAWK